MISKEAQDYLIMANSHFHCFHTIRQKHVLTIDGNRSSVVPLTLYGAYAGSDLKIPCPGVRIPPGS